MSVTLNLMTDVSPTPHVLVCDDSPTERHSLSHLLRSAGYAVDDVSDGEAAILHLKHRQIDAVLLDLNMPGVDGFEVLSYLQEHRRALPVILLSGMPLNKIQHRIHSLPTPELPPLLIKPVDPEQLLGVLEMQLSGQLPIEPGANASLEPASQQEKLARWPVTLSYFSPERGEGTPIYTLSFEVFEDGVSRALRLDYGQFALKGELTTLELLPAGECQR